MKILFYYCYYKFSKFYEDWGEEDGCFVGGGMLFSSFGFIFLSLLAFVFSLLEMKFNITIIAITIAVFGVLGLFFASKKKYEKLKERYKNEKHSKLKGWLLFIYFISSIALFFVSIAVFEM